ncbi:2-hydroxychromene-2-carboxylate isomerase [Maritalea porphyrae]|uniref:2-hydroxychromene-2-carboxylate isomerase n=1 Tax=Maritalea porphyrae TaxID=880732 RepID=A0ABQ5UMR7_9HYPH|nr:2-hydroxychromene-2-carboxylate isomerase [Maritalea porphyrae]GLQ16519.1 2-hydroxychromene-2-carboxylate isomerase [Maritalea porphyrae]
MTIIEYVYSAHSAYAYIGSKTFSQIAESNGATIMHRPILLSPVVEAQRSEPFRQRTQAHVDYFFGREIERWAEYRDVPIINYRPTHHDADYRLASGMIIALGDNGASVDAMAHALLEAHWVNDVDLSDQTALTAVAKQLGHDAENLLEKAASPSVQDQLNKNIKWARDQNVFGSPTYIVNGDPFYGQDHLELVERAIKKPFGAPNWKNPPVDA